MEHFFKIPKVIGKAHACPRLADRLLYKIADSKMVENHKEKIDGREKIWGLLGGPCFLR